MSEHIVKFHIEEQVHLVMNIERTGIVTGINFRPGSVIYMVAWDDFVERAHYDFEITNERVVEKEA